MPGVGKPKGFYFLLLFEMCKSFIVTPIVRKVLCAEKYTFCVMGSSEVVNR